MVLDHVERGGPEPEDLGPGRGETDVRPGDVASAAATTNAPPRTPPTATGRPRPTGSRRCWTETTRALGEDQRVSEVLLDHHRRPGLRPAAWQREGPPLPAYGGQGQRHGSITSGAAKISPSASCAISSGGHGGPPTSAAHRAPRSPATWCAAQAADTTRSTANALASTRIDCAHPTRARDPEERDQQRRPVHEVVAVQVRSACPPATGDQQVAGLVGVEGAGEVGEPQQHHHRGHRQDEPA